MGPTELAPGIFRISTWHAPWGLTINQFLIVDEQVALVETGLAETFPVTRRALVEVCDVRRIGFVVVPHFEADECGALNHFLGEARRAVPVATQRAVVASLRDFSITPPRAVADGEVLVLGRKRLRFLDVPYAHAWDGLVVVEETEGILFSSDLFIQAGPVEPITREDRSAESVHLYRSIYGRAPQPYFGQALAKLEKLLLAGVAPMHGSAVVGTHVPYFSAYRRFASGG